MYFAIQVMSGQEIMTENLIRAMLKEDACDGVFHLTRAVRKKLRGEWRDIIQTLIPGYVFVSTPDALKLYEGLKRVPELTKVLGKDAEANFYPLRDEDEEWLQLMAPEAMGLETEDLGEVDVDISYEELVRSGAEEKKKAAGGRFGEVQVGISYIDINENDKVTIVSGPLKGMKGKIKKIDLHRRIAEVETNFMGQKMNLHLGIEFAKK